MFLWMFIIGTIGGYKLKGLDGWSGGGGGGGGNKEGLIDEVQKMVFLYALPIEQRRNCYC